jgi:26S proteasome regulatory subunit N10
MFATVCSAMTDCVVLKPTAVAFLLDNTHSSIDGDFSPTRLEAQKLTVDHFVQYIFTVQPLSQIAFGTLCKLESGIRCSFMSCHERILGSFPSITSRCGALDLATGIRCAILALRHCKSDIVTKRILAFVGSDHDIADSTIAGQVAEQLLKEKVLLDIVAFGRDVRHKQSLRRLIPEAIASQCHFLDVPSLGTVLSDSVLASPIGPGRTRRECRWWSLRSLIPCWRRRSHCRRARRRRTQRRAGRSSAGPARSGARFWWETAAKGSRGGKDSDEMDDHQEWPDL